MADSNPRNLKQVLRFAMESSDGTKPTEMDPERAKWLQEAMSSLTVDLTQQLKEDIQLLSQLLPNALEHIDESEAVLEDILTLTEDLDLANNFFKLGGGDLLFELMFKGPEFLKPKSYQLLAHVTQNNPGAQKICVERNVIPELIAMLSKEKNLTHLKKLLLALSCLTRAYTPAVAEFRKADGFSAVLSVIHNFTDDASAKPVCDKGAFFLYCLLQEVIESSLSETEAKKLVTEITSLCLRLLEPNEHLLASLIMLFTDSSSVDTAIDVENLPQQTAKRADRLVENNLKKPLVDWLIQADERCTNSDDSADAEVQSYIGVLRCLLNKA